MSLKVAERINFTGDSATELKRLQDSVLRALNPITGVPTLDGVVVGPVTLTTSFAPVNHGLGRQFIGWQIIRNNSNAVVYEDFNSSAQNASISMKASAACTVYLWVF